KEALKNQPALYYRSDDNYKKQFGGVAPQHQYNINISGGTEKVKYFTSAGYFQQDGLFRNVKYAGVDNNSKYGRYNFRSNVDIAVTRNLQLQIDLGGSFQNSQGILGKDGNVTSPSSRHKEMTVQILSSSPFSGPGILDGKLVENYIRSFNPLDGRGASGNSTTTYLLTRPILLTKTSNFNPIVRLKHTLDYLVSGLSVSGTVSYSDTYQKGRTNTYQPPRYNVGRNPDNPGELIF